MEMGAGRGVGLTVPAWQTQSAAAPGAPVLAPAPAEAAEEITPEHGALVPVSTVRAVPAGSDEDSESDSEEDEALYPPGPLDAERCTVSGKGFSGGAAGSPVSFFVTAKDGKGKRIRDGGAYLTGRVSPLASVSGADVVDLEIRDNEDGTYTGTYTVGSRGNYELSIEVNGTPIGGSPFPVFFSPPEPKSADQGPEAASASAGVPAKDASALVPDLALMQKAAETAAAIMAPTSAIGAAAHTAGVVFPTDTDQLAKTVLVGNLSPAVNTDQLKQLFAFAGEVTSLAIVGDMRQFALVEYIKPEEAAAALGMNNMTVVDRQIKVEPAKLACEATPQSTADPFAALHAHRIAQLQLVQMQQEQLAAQVAQMRALAKTNPGLLPTAAMVPQNSASQKNAALAAAAALSKRLALLSGGGGGGGPGKPFKRSRSRSPRGRGPRRGVSPTIRYRPRSQRRSPSRDRRGSSRRRDDSRERRRRRSRSGERTRSSRRDRSDSRDKGRNRDRERERASDKDRDKDRSRGRERGRGGEVERERERDRPQRREREERDKDDGRDRQRGGDRDSGREDRHGGRDGGREDPDRPRRDRAAVEPAKEQEPAPSSVGGPDAGAAVAHDGPDSLLNGSGAAAHTSGDKAALAEQAGDADGDAPPQADEGERGRDRDRGRQYRRKRSRSEDRASEQQRELSPSDLRQILLDKKAQAEEQDDRSVSPEPRPSKREKHDKKEKKKKHKHSRKERGRHDQAEQGVEEHPVEAAEDAAAASVLAD